MTSLMTHALLVSADPVTVRQFSRALRELSISPVICQDATASIRLVKERKFDAVFIDLELGAKAGQILDLVRLSSSNQTAVTFAMAGSDANATALFRKKTGFLFDRPFSMQSIRNTLKPAYGLILREGRRYFRCPVAIPVSILREGKQEIRCSSVNISEAGMAVVASTSIPLDPGEEVRVQFSLPNRKVPYLAESRVCWWKEGRLGVRFTALTAECKYELQNWLSEKREEMLPEFVARKFREEETPLRPPRLLPIP
jgi:DNA-binding response OmpR family regulator